MREGVDRTLAGDDAREVQRVAAGIGDTPQSVRFQEDPGSLTRNRIAGLPRGVGRVEPGVGRPAILFRVRLPGSS